MTVCICSTVPRLFLHLTGLALLLLLLPLNAIVWSIMEKYQYSQMLKKDERVRLITEILNGIKVLKLYGWEESFVDRINQIRDTEVYQLKIFQFLEATQFFAWTAAPLLVALASFATFVLIDPINNILDSQTAFVSLTLFNTMRGPLFLLPFGIVSIIQGMVSIGRIGNFLNMEEINPQNVSAATNFVKLPWTLQIHFMTRVFYQEGHYQCCQLITLK